MPKFDLPPLPDTNLPQSGSLAQIQPHSNYGDQIPESTSLNPNGPAVQLPESTIDHMPDSLRLFPDDPSNRPDSTNGNISSQPTLGVERATHQVRANKARPLSKASKLSRVAMVALALGAPGKGLVDRVADQFIDGGEETAEILTTDRVSDGEVLYDMLHLESADSGLLQGDKRFEAFADMDAVELENHKTDVLKAAEKSGQAFVKEILDENEEYFENEKSSAQAVAEVFGNLDDGNTDQLTKDAQEIIDANPDQYMTDIEVQGVKDAISEAQTPEELLKAIEPTFNTYGKKLDISALGKDIASAKNYTKAMIDVFSVLPRGFVKDDMKFTTFRIVPAGKDAQETAMGKSAGHYNSAVSEIVLRDTELTDINEALGISGQSMRSIVAHEMGHTYLEKPYVEGDNSNVAIRITRHLISQMFGSPREVSIYGIMDQNNSPEKGGEEASADIADDTFTGGYNVPDSARQFESHVNQDRLRLMQSIEQKFPGSTKVLVGRTMDKEAKTQLPDLLQYAAYAAVTAKMLGLSIRSKRKK